MLSVINWSNEGNAGNDSDGFNAVFGANAAQARFIVERAILDWEEVIVDFHHTGGGNTYSLQVSMGELGDSLRAQGGATNFDFDLVPTIGAITLDLDAAGSGWYIDPAIGDDGEFDTILGPYSATGSIVGNDLYRTITHEIGHAVGMTNTTLRLSLFLTDLMVDDPVTEDPGNLWAFNVNGGPIEATFTAADAGHLYEGPAIAGRADIPVHPNDLMNPGRASADNNRKLISDLDATILRDAYGYTVAMPSTLNNMLVNPNFTTDVLTINGQPGAVNDVVLVTSAAGGFNVVVGGFSEIAPLSQVSSIAINTGDGTDQVHLTYNAAKPTTVDGGDGVGDLLFLNGGATVTLTTVTSAPLNTVTYDNLEALILTGSAGNDIFSVKSTSSFTPVTINAGIGADSLFINPNSGSLVLYSSPITWNGGDDADTLQFDMQPSGFNDQYTVTGSAVLVDRLNGVGEVTVNQVGFSYFSDLVVINAGSGADVISLPETNLHGTFSGGLGNDSFIVGGGNVGTSYTSATLSGGTGNDTLVLDDSLYAGAANWAINDVNVQRNIPGSAQSFSYAGFEGIGIKTGAGGGTANNITTFGAIPVSVAVTGGAGADNFFINNLANEAAGGPAGPEQLQSMFDGGGGFNQLIVDDSARGILTYNMYPTRLEILEVLADDGEFSFLNIGAMSVTASDSLTTLNVYGTPAHIVPGNQTTVVLRGGNDVANVFPHDAAGNLTVTTNIGIIGDSGTDTFTVQDAASAGAINYSFSNPFGSGTQNIFGMGTGGLGTATIENLVVNAGTGADVFNVDQYKSGTGLTLNAGGGDDTLNFGGGNLPFNITSLDSFHFDGQIGFDRFNLDNANEITQWQYIRDAGTIRADRGAPFFGYSVVLADANIEEMTVNAGPTVDTFYVRANATGTSTVLNAGGGLDGLVLADSTQNLSGIQGLVTYNAGADGGNMLVSDNADTTGDTAHFTDTTLGAISGDNLFGPGGSLEFHDLVNSGEFPGITLNLSSGADTIYAQPLSSARVAMNAGNPTAAPGDTLNLALAGVMNYVVNGTPANGNVTSSNFQTLSYSGFETSAIVDDVAPYIVDTLTDESDGNASLGNLSLREALERSNFTSAVDTIAFSPALSGGTIALMLGALRITGSVIIAGPGADLLTIDASGNDPTPLANEGNGSRVFNIDDGTSTLLTVSIAGLTLTGGDVTGFGGGIYSRENLSVSTSKISGNSATTGGGFHSIGGNLTVASSTISGNSASTGGGIYSFSSSWTITNSTISGNAAKSSGGGILNFYGTALLAHSTITGNVADSDGNGSGAGGGIAVVDNPYYPSVNVQLNHTIVAGNIRGASTRSDISGLINSARFSLIGDNTGASIVNNGGNLIGTPAAPIDPILGPLADNGGPTMTHVLLAGSPAIDAGDTTAVAGVGTVPLNDQRGAPFGRIVDGNAAPGAWIDIGALELQPLPPAFFGDFNADGSIDAADYVVWRKTLGSSGVPAYSGADGNGNAVIDQPDYGVWRAHFGETLPPPGAASGMGAFAAGTNDAGGHSEIGASFATLAEPLTHGSQPGAGGSEQKVIESSETTNSAPFTDSLIF